MRKKKRWMKIAFLMMLLLVSFMFIMDLQLAKNNEEPEFARFTAGYEDGGSKKYVGLFYNVFYVKELSETEEEEIIEYGYYVRPWFYSLERLKKDIKNE